MLCLKKAVNKRILWDRLLRIVTMVLEGHLHYLSFETTLGFQLTTLVFFIFGC